jgi:hypothetical protein
MHLPLEVFKSIVSTRVNLSQKQKSNVGKGIFILEIRDFVLMSANQLAKI